MGFFSSTKLKKSGADDGDDYSEHPVWRNPSSTRHIHSPVRERDFQSRNYYHRAGFIEPEDRNIPHGRHSFHRTSRRESADHGRGRRAAAPSLSPMRARYENEHRAAYRQRTRSPRASSRSRAPESWTSFRAGQQRSLSPGRFVAEDRRKGRQGRGNDGGLAEQLAGLNVGREERRYGRRRPSYTSRVERIYEIK